MAHFLLDAGFKHGDSVALFMENRPEYIGLWLGCTKVGLVPALINFNLRAKSLMHSISAVSASAVIFGKELHEGIGFHSHNSIVIVKTMMMFFLQPLKTFNPSFPPVSACTLAARPAPS